MSVVVVGAGIVGCATTYELTKRGVSVTLVDRGEVSGGTTGLGEGNVLCSDKDAGPELELAVAGMPLFDEIEEVVGEAARIRRKGALIVHPDEETWEGEPARLERLRAAGVNARTAQPGHGARSGTKPDRRDPRRAVRTRRPAMRPPRQ